MRIYLILLISASLGCSTLLTAQTKGSDASLTDELRVYIPNAFTPNSDGYNDYWIPVISGPAIESYEVMVMDRYGKEVFTSQDPKQVWNGSTAGNDYVSSPSIFLYFLKIKVVGDPENKVYQGHITMVR